MAIIRIEPIAPTQSNAFISPEAATAPNRAAMQLGDAIKDEGIRAIHQGVNSFKEGMASLASSELTRAESAARLEFGKRVQERLSTPNNEDGTPNYSTLIDDIGKIGSEVKGKYMDQAWMPQVKSRLGQTLDTLITNTQLGNLKTQRKFEIDTIRAAGGQAIEAAVQEQAINPILDIHTSLRGVNQKIDELMLSGAYSGQEAADLRDRARHDIATAHINKIIEQNPHDAMQMLTDPESLLLNEAEAIRARLQASAKMRDTERNIIRQTKAQLQERRTMARELQSTLDLRIRKMEDGLLGDEPEVTMAEIRASQDILDALSPNATAKMEYKLLKAQQQMEDKNQTADNVLADVDAGNSLMKYRSSDVDKAFNKHLNIVKESMVKVGRLQANQPLSLAMKGQVAKSYKGPVPLIQKELNSVLLYGDAASQEVTEALSTYNDLSKNNGEVLDGADLTKKAELIGIAANQLMLGGRVPSDKAISMARNQILAADDSAKAIRAKEISKSDLFKSPPDMNKRVLKELDASGIFGLGAADMAPEVTETYKELYKGAYIETGNIQDAQKYAATQLKKSYKETAFNGGNFIMFMPPEAIPALNGVNPRLIKDSLREDVQKVLGSPISETMIQLTSDDITKMRVARGEQPTYSVAVDKDGDGIAETILMDAHGRALRWTPDVQGLLDKKKGGR